MSGGALCAADLSRNDKHLESRYAGKCGLQAALWVLQGTDKDVWKGYGCEDVC